MSLHRTAMGKSLDMAALQAKNEKVRAVGNMSVNARGDTIDSNGKIITPVTSKTGESYAKTVGNRSANPLRNIQPTLVADTKPVEELDTFEFTQAEQELNESADDDLLTENIKQEETKNKTVKKK
jgi:hypothetical protein